MRKTKTTEQIKAEFYEKGITLASWSKENGYRPQDVYRVIGGFTKGKYGKAHDIAVKLGLKEG